MTNNLSAALAALRRTCLRCDHIWMQRTTHEPVKCPRCKSSYWNKPRRVKSQLKEQS